MRPKIAEFLGEMVCTEGIDCLKDSIRMNGCLADFFPEAKKERNAIRAAMNIEFGIKFCRIAGEKDEMLKVIRLRQLKAQLLYEAWLSEEAANYIIITFAKAVSMPLKGLYEYQYKESTVNNMNVLADKTKQILLDAGLEYVYEYAVELMKTSEERYHDYGTQLLELAAEREYAPAQTKLAQIYEKNKELPKAFAWYQRSAANDDAEAAFRLSEMYRISGDKKAAAIWCGKAAGNGHEKAQLQYGIILQYGIGVPSNQQLALQWYRRCGNQGNEEAKKRHKELLKIFKDVEI
ncbi:MAG: tetratricopeptide repeat protein [Lachnospiraceae bacterium]|nr:tetratricopeptide repeat protein [Lachnospiraceae bacterium]